MWLMYIFNWCIFKYICFYVFFLLQVMHKPRTNVVLSRTIRSSSSPSRHFYLHKPSHCISRMRSLSLRITKSYISLPLTPPFTFLFWRDKMITHALPWPTRHPLQPISSSNCRSKRHALFFNLVLECISRAHAIRLLSSHAFSPDKKNQQHGAYEREVRLKK